MPGSFQYSDTNLLFVSLNYKFVLFSIDHDYCLGILSIVKAGRIKQ